MKQFDVAIIGAGWAGFNAALQARRAGMSVCIVERSEIGGTCLNRGCIPTKALIRSAKNLSLCQKARRFGIDVASCAADMHSMQAYKQNLVSGLRVGMRASLKGVEWIPGEARFISAEALSVGNEEIRANDIVICTGSYPADLPCARFDKQKVFSSDDILTLEQIPQSLLIIGAGAIGCEFASLFGALGSSVTLVEKEPQLLPGLDPAAARKLETVFRKRGITVRTGSDTSQFPLRDFSLVLVAVGRKPQLDGLDLDKAGIRIDKNAIVVDEYCRTTQPRVWAAGDCRGGLMLAHFAAHQGRIAVRNTRGANLKLSDAAVPSCVFTNPEIAVAGIHEQQAAERGIKARVHIFDFLGSGMARIMDETDGFLKIVSEEATGVVIGSTIVGPSATELIAVLTCAISNHLTTSQLKETIYAHPTIAESINDALSRFD
jgi:dihydrolipoamide dehydrogenase